MSQTSQIADYLRAGNPITPLEALSLCGCSRLAARVAELKKAGMKIEKEMVEVTTRAGSSWVARYSLNRDGNHA